MENVSVICLSPKVSDVDPIRNEKDVPYSTGQQSNLRSTTKKSTETVLLGKDARCVRSHCRHVTGHDRITVTRIFPGDGSRQSDALSIPLLHAPPSDSDLLYLLLAGRARILSSCSARVTQDVSIWR